jgi:hypothetical protein
VPRKECAKGKKWIFSGHAPTLEQRCGANLITRLEKNGQVSSLAQIIK